MARGGVRVAPDHARLGARFGVAFHRTLRLPLDDEERPLPPGLGLLPMHPAPRAVEVEGADATVLVPLHRYEATWIGFRSQHWHPTAATIALGRVNAVSGAVDGPWPALSQDPQSYVVCPPQVWLDGVNAGPGRVRQLVAVPWGRGESVESAVTGDDTGGVTIAAFAARPGRFPDERPPSEPVPHMASPFRGPPRGDDRMAVGAGGSIRQRIYPDPHGLGTWDTTSTWRLAVVVVDADAFRRLTGQPAPPSPIDAQTYADHGLPWFDLDDEDLGDLEAPTSLTDLPPPGGMTADDPTDHLHVDDDHVVVIEGPTPATPTTRHPHHEPHAPDEEDDDDRPAEDLPRPDRPA